MDKAVGEECLWLPTQILKQSPESAPGHFVFGAREAKNGSLWVLIRGFPYTPTYLQPTCGNTGITEWNLISERERFTTGIIVDCGNVLQSVPFQMVLGSFQRT